MHPVGAWLSRGVGLGRAYALECASPFAREDWTDDFEREGELFAFLAQQDCTPALSYWFDARAARSAHARYFEWRDLYSVAREVVALPAYWIASRSQ